MRHIILASQSPRRQELLARLGVIFTVIPANIKESIAFSQLPEEATKHLALQKARYVAENADIKNGDLIIAADTIVVLENNILGKPKDEKEAFTMLSRLSGKEHVVITGLCLLDTGNGDFQLEDELTRVHFRHLSAKEISNYIATGESFDKAGAYGIQGKGAVLVDRIEGCYYNVVGLPLTRLYLMLRRSGIDLMGG